MCTSWKNEHNVIEYYACKSDNEKGYYIVDTINEAINTGVKISFLYFELDGKKRQVLKNDGRPHIVSPFDLISGTLHHRGLSHVYYR